MTSSLVGSEMCIRDRWQAPLLRHASIVRRRRLLVRKGWGLLMPRLVAVSYTHLTLPTICSV
eukprot:12625726-Prorocentrum_lima.AAC.1